MKYLLVAFLFFTATKPVPAQGNVNTWKILSDVTFKRVYNESLGIKIDSPLFGQKVRALEGQTIVIKGYIVPTDGYRSEKAFVFSAFPYSICFFNGGAGPETVVEVSALKPVRFTTEPVYLRGILRLNGTDPDHLLYSLEMAEKL